MSVNDDILAQLLREGDEAAFGKLYESLWEPLFGYVVRVLRDEDDTMDVVQETFVALWQQRHVAKNIGSVKAYVFTIARHKAFRHIRLNIEKNDYLPSLLGFLHGQQGSPEDILISKELQDLIDHEVASLPPRMREVFLLSRNENLSYKEIAERLNISDKTVKKQISNSLKILRLKLNGGHLSTLLLFFFFKGL